VNPSTYLLWFGPFVLFVLAGGVLIYNLRRRRQLIEDAPLSEADHKRAEDLLKQVAGENKE
jgi:cytochrome c-type biogenesis protein CcmH